MPSLVIVTRRAEADIDAAVRWMSARRSPQVTARWQLGLRQTLAALGGDPTRYAQADEAADLGCDLRETTHRRGRTVYRVLFTIDGTVVSVLRVRHAAQDRLTDADL